RPDELAEQRERQDREDGHPRPRAAEDGGEDDRGEVGDREEDEPERVRLAPEGVAHGEPPFTVRGSCRPGIPMSWRRWIPRPTTPSAAATSSRGSWPASTGAWRWIRCCARSTPRRTSARRRSG